MVAVIPQISDLEQSIVDGRYYEQKRSMQQCGLSRLIYLVEGNTSSARLGKGVSVEYAMLSSQVRVVMLPLLQTTMPTTWRLCPSRFFPE